MLHAVKGDIIKISSVQAIENSLTVAIKHNIRTLAFLSILTGAWKGYYERCYLETLENMVVAQRFYEEYGFEKIFESVGETRHFECDVRYIKTL